MRSWTRAEIGFDPETVAANAILAGILLLLLVDVSIFNSTIKENEAYIMGVVGGVACAAEEHVRTPGRAMVARRCSAASAKPAPHPRLIGAGLLLTRAWVKFDTSAVVLFPSLIIGIAVATYVYEGAQVLVAESDLCPALCGPLLSGRDHHRPGQRRLLQDHGTASRASSLASLPALRCLLIASRMSEKPASSSSCR